MNHARPFMLAAFALLALLVPSATASASADLFLTGTASGDPMLDASEYPTTVEAERPNEGAATVLETPDGVVTCSTADFHQSGSLDEPQDSLTLSSTGKGYGDCEFDLTEGGSFDVEVTPNSCRFAYSSFANVSGPDFAAATAIECDNGDEIEIKEPQGLCVIDVPAQTLSEPAALTNTVGEGEGNLSIATGGSEVTYDVSDELFCGLVGLEGGVHEDGAIDIDLLAANVFMTGESGKVEASEYPKAIDGERFEESGVEGTLDVFDWGAGKLSCEAVDIDGGMLSGPAYSLNLAPTFSECDWDLDMNSCGYFIPDFEYQDDGNYHYDPEISCAEEGDAIEVGDALCTFSITPQALETKFQNVAINKETEGQKNVAMAIHGEGMDYTSEGEFCGLLERPEGSYEDGAMALYVRLN